MEPRARRLLIVWWSMTGGSRQLAEAAAAGAREAGGGDGGESGSGGASRLAVDLVRADRAGPDDVLASAGFLFVAPENLGTVAGMMKDFFDRTYYAALDEVNGRPYAAIVCAGSDGQGAARQIERIATGWRLRRIAETLIVCTHAQTPEAILAPKTIPPAELDRAREVGATLAGGLSLGLW
jgi:hypothetical protein